MNDAGIAAFDTDCRSEYRGDDGLLYCAECDAPKQGRVDSLRNGPILFRRRCDCEREEEIEAEIERMQTQCIESEKFRYKTFADDDGADRKTGEILRRYAEKWPEMQKENIGLLLHGEVGGGKTFWSACIANAIIADEVRRGKNGGWRGPVLLTTAQALRDKAQKDYGAQKGRVLDGVREVGLLILDDFGFEKKTSASDELLFDIINARYDAGKPLIVTTNLTLAELSNAQDVKARRIFDRVIEMCQPIHVGGEGRRQAIARNKGEKARSILGI